MKIALTSIPKSGTHLLATVVEKMLGDYGATLGKKVDFSSGRGKSLMSRKVICGHLRLDTIITPQHAPYFIGRRVAILVRDPRDICNSMVYYLEKSHRDVHQMMSKSMEGLTHEEKVMRVADGISLDGVSANVPSIDKACRGFIEIAEYIPDSMVFRYEEFFDDAVAPKLAAFFEVSPEVARAAVAESLGADTRTKREGKKQPWRSNFSPALIDFFEQKYGETIRYLGY
ncbi:hypothetical protein ACX40Y_09185 [Sphingomonas sp. RS6]